MTHEPRYMFIVRGLPGSGKTTLVESLEAMPIAADDFFYDAHGAYHFDPERLAQAHDECQRRARLYCGDSNVAVHNTFSRKWEAQPYIDMAREFGMTLVVIDLFDGGLTDSELAARNAHGVPEDAIRRMRARWERS